MGKQVMVLTISKEDLLKQLFLQLRSHFLLDESEKHTIEDVLERVLERCEVNFSNSNNKYFHCAQGTRFNPYHSIQHMVFLYFLSNELYVQKKSLFLCDKVYYLNKIMNGCDLFYAIELPDKFGAEHPLASVMGRAIYGNGFFFYQGCTVGGTTDSEGVIHYPVLEENVHMFANSSILGRCHIGSNVNIGAGAIVKNQDIQDNCTVFGESPNLIIKQNRQ